MPVPSRLPATAFLIAALPLCGMDVGNDWFRQGLQAFGEGKYTVAVRLFDTALPISTDPGQVAFMQGAAHAALQEDALAELAFQRCLEDAQGLRRVLALWGRGNALAQLGYMGQGKFALAQLHLAVECLERALHALQHLPEQYRRDRSLFSEHLEQNLKTVREIVSQKEKEVRAESDENPSEQPQSPGSPQKPEGFPDPAREKEHSDRQFGEGETEGKQRPGRGQLPVLLDDKNATPLTPEQAQAYLQQTMDRIRSQSGLANGKPAKSGARDW